MFSPNTRKRKDRLLDSGAASMGTRRETYLARFARERAISRIKALKIKEGRLRENLECGLAPPTRGTKVWVKDGGSGEREREASRHTLYFIIWSRYRLGDSLDKIAFSRRVIYAWFAAAIFSQRGKDRLTENCGRRRIAHSRFAYKANWFIAPNL